MNGKEDILWCTELERCVHTPSKDFIGWFSQQHPKQISLLLSLQDFRLPHPLHGCVQHGSRGQTEAAGTVLECTCDPTPVCPTQGLLCLRIAPVASYSKYIKHNANVQNQTSSLKQQGPLGYSFISQIRSQFGELSWEVGLRTADRQTQR